MQINKNNCKLDFEQVRKLKDYFYSGDVNTPNYIINKFQSLASTKLEEERSIVSLKFFDYLCELDIFWEEEIETNSYKLVVELFVTHEDSTINNSWELSLLDILKPNYLEWCMFNFLLESADDNIMRKELKTNGKNSNI
ncbi:hypothetical protein [Clostridium sp.]|uniref:hypothetical protein n=1 Tax=Clostridium sp. TaxID=1506 RepID=UPI001D789011|nr:hypothetical protein [Clostridium sp.]MBS5307748.1 hypothetical protein [Clostridium sp.]